MRYLLLLAIRIQGRCQTQGIITFSPAAMKRLLALLWLVAAAGAAQAQTFTTITAFTILTNVSGHMPQSQLVQGPDGTLYGTTSRGSGPVEGTIFKMQPDGTGFTVLKRYTNSIDGATPLGRLALDGATLYGTTFSGGSSDYYGTVFKVNTDGTGYAVLKHFTGSDGRGPRDLLLNGATLYGITYSGGISDFFSRSGYGTVFKINTDGTGHTVLKYFNGSDGSSPNEVLVLNGGTLYGATHGGGSEGYGTVFKMNMDGTGHTVLKNFTFDDRGPRDLVLNASSLYGTTIDSLGYGRVFKMNTDGAGYTMLKSSVGRFPNGLLLNGSALYGTTAGVDYDSSDYGTVFKLNTDGTGYAVLKNFAGSDGANPYAGLLLNAGTLYGTTSATVFKLNTNGTGHTVLKNFTPSDANSPRAALLLNGGTLYGTTKFGGSSRAGTVFKVNLDGTGCTVLKHFTGSDGRDPEAALVLSGSTLYGTTVYGGGSQNYGTVFKLNTDGTGYTVLKRFTGSDGENPYAGLVLDGSTLYGTTFSGGSSNRGTVFKLNTDGTGYTVLKHFTGSDGALPYAGLVLNGETLYGTTFEGGSSDNGTVFRLNKDGTGYIVLKNFTDYYSQGAYPYAGLLLNGGTLYGTTSVGGTSGSGTVFKLNTDGTDYNVLNHFDSLSGNGSDPRGTLVLNGSTLYGTTFQGGSSGYGTIFQVNTNGTGYAVLRHFSASDGESPRAGLMLNDSTLYGALSRGGEFQNGTVFALTIGPAPFIISQPQSQTVNPGDNITLSVVAGGADPLAYQWRKDGTNLLGATNPALTLNDIQPDHAGAYSVVITNAAGWVTSSNATLTLNLSLEESLDTPGWQWTTGGNNTWFGQAVLSHDGVDAAQSGSISDIQQSWMETIVTGPGTLSFWWKVSSEGGYDFLEFYINDVLQSGRISGAVDWHQKTFTLPAGNHLLRWRYRKDGGARAGQDCGWVDAVAFVPPQPLQISTAGSFGFSNGQFGFNITGPNGAVIAIDGSTNLIDWIPISTLTLGDGPLYFSDPQTNSLPARYYRVRTQ